MNFIRRCAHCRKRTGKVDFLCEHCWFYLNSKTIKENELSLNYRFLVRRLFVWDRLDSDFIKLIIYSLKNGHSEKVIERLCVLFLSQVNFSYGDVIFIPAPGKKNEINHALLIAEGFAKITGFSSCDIFENESSNNRQKKLKRNERKNKVLKIKDKLSILDKTIIFVDDVITTGSTAEAAYFALGKPRKFQVWVLAEKTLVSYPQAKSSTSF